MANTIAQAVKAMKFREKENREVIEGRACYKGVRKSFYGKTKSECQNKARQYFENMEKENSTSTIITLEKYMENWLDNKQRISEEPSSYARQVRVFNCQIKGSKLGQMKLSDITANDIQKVINDYANSPAHETSEQRKERMKEWAEKQKKLGTKDKVTKEQWAELRKKEMNKVPLLLAKSGLNRLKHLINPCLNQAVKDGLIKSNPCEDIIIPTAANVRTKTKEQFSMDDNEIKRFKEAALIKTANGTVKYRDAVVCVLLVATGMRVGEMLALQWDDVHYDKNYIHIHHTLQTGLIGENKTIIKDGSKTNAGRLLPMNDSIKEYLQMLKDFDKEHGIEHPNVACTRASTPQTPRNLARSLDLLIKRAGITENVTPHTLRHTFGSTLIRNGVGIEVVSELLGHANISITYNKYIHIIKEQKVKSMELVTVI